MTVQIIGQNNGGTTNNFVSDDILICPTSLSPSGTDPRIRKLAFHARPSSVNVDYVVYESTIDDLTTATPLHTGSVPRYDTYSSPQEFLFEFDLDLALNPANFYWIGLKFPGGSSAYVSSGGGVNFVRLDSFNVGVSEDWPSPAGAFTASGEKLNFYAEIVDRGSKLTTTIGASPNTSANSLLSLDAKYQLQNAQVRYDEYSENLNAVTVFDDGRFVIDGYGSDSFVIELAEPSSSFDTPQIISVVDASASTATSGGNAQLSWSAPSGLSDGNTLSLVTDGSLPFGAKAQSAPVLWDFGTEVFENGVANTHRSSVADGYVVEDSDVNADELYGNASSIRLVTSSRPLRHARSKGHYMPHNATDSPFVDRPKAEGTNVPAHDYHYLAFRVKYRYHFQKIHVIDYTGKTGTFSTPDLINNPDALGEQLTLNNGEVAYLLQDTGSRLCFYTPNTTARQNDLANTTITGQVSGATCSVVDNGVYTDDHSGPEKIVRVWSEGDGQSGFRYTWSRYQSDLTGVPNVNNSYGDINDSGADEDEWALLELFIDLSTTTLIIACNGVKLAESDFSAYTGYSGTWDMAKGLQQRAIGWQAVRTLYNVVEFGEIYLDHASQRLFIGNAPTWGACTKREIQRPQGSWQTNSTEFTLHQGSLDSLYGAYFFFIDNGYPEPTLEGVKI